MSKKVNRIGQRYWFLVVISDAGPDKWGNATWYCLCDCGATVIVPGYKLQSGHTKSCGCFRKKNTKGMFTTHGLSQHPLCAAWHSMKRRCYNSKNKNYKWYGGKGVRVWAPWHKDFMVFFKWAIAHGYKTGLTLDRIDSDKHYCPSNCQFIPLAKNVVKKQNIQSNNTSGFQGVSWRKDTKKYTAVICVLGNHSSLGCFDDPIEAAHVYDQVAKEANDGRFINFP